MSIKRTRIFKYWVPALAVLVIAIQLVLCRTLNLSSWKGGGFGMYAEVHYYYHDVYVSPLNVSLDSLQDGNKNLADAIMKVKRMPSNSNIKKLGSLVSEYVTSDSISVQVWRPVIDGKNSKYSRELLKELNFIKSL